MESSITNEEINKLYDTVKNKHEQLNKKYFLNIYNQLCCELNGFIFVDIPLYINIPLLFLMLREKNCLMFEKNEKNCLMFYKVHYKKYKIIMKKSVDKKENSTLPKPVGQGNE